jgi:DNA-binding response OmpR family regulator
MQGRVLIIGKEDGDIKALRKTLKEKSNFVSRAVEKKDFFTETMLKFKPDLIVLNPEASVLGMLDLYHKLRNDRVGAELPVILLISEEECLRAEVPIGLNDVIVKPLRPSEAVSRILLTYKKTHRVSEENVIRSRDVEIDISKYEVKVKNNKITLTYTEYELLKFFISHPGQVFNRDVLLNKVWGYDYFGGARTVDVHVRRLRSKIENGSQTYIETIRNIGYKFLVGEDE